MRNNEPILYTFDVYIQAALKIQKVYAGYIQRKRLFGQSQCFKNYKAKVLLLQKNVRKFLESRRERYLQYTDYMCKKSEKIILSLRHFYKINGKFDTFRKQIGQKTNLLNEIQKSQLSKVDESVFFVEQVFKKIT